MAIEVCDMGDGKDKKMYKDESKKIFLVGSPNVGKSAIFNALTGSYVTVSNYPGTTVDVSEGVLNIGEHHKLHIVDTPGMYSLKPITGEEDVTRRLIFEESPDCILHIVDAKNLGRMLPLTFQLMETGFPVILVLNLYDEMIAQGMKLNIAHIEHDLGIPVVETVAVKGIGIENLSSRVLEVVEGRYNFNVPGIRYTDRIEDLIKIFSGLMENGYAVSKRTMALMAFQGDGYVLDMIKKERRIEEIKELLKSETPEEIMYSLSRTRKEAADGLIAERITQKSARHMNGWGETLSRLMVHPVFGVPLLFLVLWFGLYKFVGSFGAGTLVDWIETNIFEGFLNPRVDGFFSSLFGDGVFYDLFAGEYGIMTLGIRYAVAIILPIVATFFIAFSIIEDTGYLPRLAMLVDRIFKKIGLSGRAVIPLTLGFGCDTMATIVTRTLESNKEKILATFLLALAVPCSAQLGVLLGLLSGKPAMFAIWAFIILLVFMLAGFLGKHLIRGEETYFFMELPPLRLPSVMNIFIKTYTRMIWYFKEVIPIFVLASVLIWAGKLTGIFDLLIRIMSLPVKWAGMPESASAAFLYGFFRRDFGAAGLFDLTKRGELAGNSLLVAAVVLTLFLLCLAQFAITWKERGKGMAIGMAMFIFPFAFFVGFVLNLTLKIFGVEL